MSSFQALLVGISEYDDPTVPPLTSTLNDLRSVGAALESRGYVVGDDRVVGGRVTRTELLTYVQQFLQGAGPEETLLIFLSAQGARYEGTDYLIPTDANLSWPKLTDVSVPLTAWSKLIDSTMARSVLFLVDAGREVLNESARGSAGASDNAVERQPWAHDISKGGAAGQVAWVFATEPGGHAWQRVSDGESFSLFADAVRQVTADPDGPNTLAGFCASVDQVMMESAKGLGRPPAHVTCQTQADADTFLVFPPRERTTSPSASQASGSSGELAGLRPSLILAEGERVMAVSLAPAGFLADDAPSAIVARSTDLCYFHLYTGAESGHVPASDVYSLWAIPRTRELLTGGLDGIGRIWNARATSSPRELVGHTGQVNGVAVDRDGRFAATASDDGTVRLWNVRPSGPSSISVLSGHSGFVNAVLFAGNAEGAALFSAGADGTLRSFSFSTGKQLWVASYSEGPIHTIVPAGYNNLDAVVAGHDNGTCSITSLGTGEELLRFHAHEGPVRGLAAIGGALVASIGGDGVVRIWDLESADLGSQARMPTTELSYQPAGAGWSVAAAHVDGQLCVVSGHDHGALSWMLDIPDRSSVKQAPTYYAGLLADVAQGEDRLGVSAEVNTLCDVIMAREVTPPLSVGLFGDWGTGKSFFMALMRKRITQLAKASEQARIEGLDTGLCVTVCQIEFNAWHYIDTNLWASLASKIFNKLANAGAYPEVQRVIQDLPSVRAVRQSMDERRRQAEAKLTEIDAELLQEEPVGFRDLTLATLTEARGSFGQQVGDRVDGVLKKAGVPKEKIEELDLHSMLPQIRKTGGRLIFLMRRGKWSVRLTLVLALLLLIIGPPVLTLFFRQYLGDFTAGISSLIGCIVAALLLARPYLDRVGYFLKVTEDAVSNVDQQRQTVVQARKNAQQRRINSLQQEIAALDAQIDALKEADSIQAFAIKRLADDEYHRQEGLLSLLRRDLEELSRRLAPSGVGSSMSGAPVPDMERIILYIDDLDRCPADRVVQVLQAIHLLLAFPLFVVIVGVDSRWLLRSLRAHYREVLGAADGRAEGDEKSVDEHWAATPQNYLEKIFQISLCLRPMSSTGYEGLVAADIGRVLEDGVNIPAASPEVESGSVVADSTTDDISVGLASEGSATRVPTALSRQERNTASVQATMIQQYIEQGRVLAVGFSPSFSTTQPVLISVTTTGHITCRDLRRTSAELLADHRVGSSVTTAHLTTDNRALVIEEPVPGRSMTFSRIIDSRTGEEASRIDVNCEDGIHADDVVMSHDGKAVAVSWATDDGRTLGQSVADLEAQTILDSADRIDGVPRLLAHSWRIEYRDGSCQWIANDPSRQPVFLGVHPASRFITDQRESRFAAISPEGLQVWSIDNEPTSIPLPEDASGYGSPLDIATLGPGTLLATAIDRNVKVWDLASARLRTEVTIDSTVTAIGFSADGRRLAVGTEDGTIQLWLIATPRPNEELASEPLRLTRAEATSIISVKSLIRTPRSALRLVNIYRLLRAGLRDDELEQLQSQDHGPVMLMLAIMIAFPRQSASLLGQLIGDDPLPGTFTGLIRSQLHKSSVPTIIRRDRLHSAEPAGLHVWRRLGSTVGRLITETMMQDEIGVYQRWAPYVARFSFRTEHLM